MPKAHPTLPKLVSDDVWLESQTDAINDRIRCFQDEQQRITAKHHSLTEYANAHHLLGIHFDHTSQQWLVREWAPQAKSIQLIGDFNAWNGENHHLKRLDGGLWELSLPKETLHHEAKIKLRIHGADDSLRDRIPTTIQRAAQEIDSIDYFGQVWSPEQPYEFQHSYDPRSVSSPYIYEAHTGIAGEEPRLHTYREFADYTIPRIVDLGYNVIQLMAVQEHPYYGSFGYHVSNFFAASSRFGTPEDLKYLIDTAHKHGIAIIMDIVHSHAVKNIAEGINEFDGTDHQFFHGGGKGDHPQWDSKCFNYGKEEVRRYLLSNVRFWLEEFQFDGFRFDGITSMLYEHHGNIAFDNYDKYFKDGVDTDAILYLQLATALAEEIRPGALLIAEDMSGMPGLCRPISEGGIGFTHRLAMGLPDYWIKLLKHTKDEDWNVHEIWGTLTNRRKNEANISYVESHDQALVGDKTIAFWLMDQLMYWHMAKDDDHQGIARGIALHKMLRLITLALGGEGYLNFMGNEFGHPEWLDFPRQGNDWSYHYCRRQWSLVDNPELKYQFLNQFDKKMIQTARAKDLLYSFPADQLWCHDGDKIIAFERRNLIFIFNFHPTESFSGYGIPVKEKGSYHIILDSDKPEFGGFERIDDSLHYTSHNDDEGVEKVLLYLPSRTAMVLERLSL